MPCTMPRQTPRTLTIATGPSAPLMSEALFRRQGCFGPSTRLRYTILSLVCFKSQGVLNDDCFTGWKKRVCRKKKFASIIGFASLVISTPWPRGKHPLSAYKRPLGNHDIAEHYLFTSVYHHVYYKKSFSIFPCRLGL